MRPVGEGAKRTRAGIESTMSSRSEFERLVAHNNTFHQANGNQVRHNGAASITDKWQCQTGGRHQIKVNAYIDNRLESDQCRNAVTNQRTERVTRNARGP